MRPIPVPRRPLLVALPLAMLIVGGIGARATRAAEDGLRIVTDTTYDAQPTKGRVHVTIDASATNTTPDDADGRTYFTGITFALPPRATHVVATSEGVTLPVVVRQANGSYTSVEVTYHRRVFYNQVYRYRVAFDLADAGDAPDRDVRVTRSVVAFPVWAFGSSGTTGSSVSVRLPTGYTATVEGGPLNSSRDANGATILSATDLADPFEFFAYISADRPGAFVETDAIADLGTSQEPVIVRSWEDDPAWGTRMSDLMGRGIPVLADLIGLPYPVHGRLRVEEAATSRLGEYAGTYNDTTELITVRYDADAVVALHEASHIWFNESLMRGRWIGEAFAEYYGVEAAKALGEPGQTFELTDAELKSRIPLNDWGAVGVENLGVEDYAYAATYKLATLIAERTDADGLRAVWRASRDGEMSYQSPTATDATDPEQGVSASLEDWQRLLDLLEERTGTAYDDLWRAWVVNPDQAGLLDTRATLRASYLAAIDEAGDWQLPRSIRFELGAWQFKKVSDDLSTAHEVLDDRERITIAARSLDLSPSNDLRTAFEGRNGLESAVATATNELEALDAIGSATETVGAPVTALESVGLLGTSPAIDLAAARKAYESGDPDAATSHADAARAARDGADATGRQRVAVAGGGLLVLDLAAVGAFAIRRRQRRRAQPMPPAAAA